MFDKSFLQILAVRLSGGMSLDWIEPEKEAAHRRMGDSPLPAHANPRVNDKQIGANPAS